LRHLLRLRPSSSALHSRCAEEGKEQESETESAFESNKPIYFSKQRKVISTQQTVHELAR